MVLGCRDVCTADTAKVAHEVKKLSLTPNIQSVIINSTSYDVVIKKGDTAEGEIEWNNIFVKAEDSQEILVHKLQVQNRSDTLFIDVKKDYDFRDFWVYRELSRRC